VPLLPTSLRGRSRQWPSSCENSSSSPPEYDGFSSAFDNRCYTKPHRMQRILRYISDRWICSQSVTRTIEYECGGRLSATPFLSSVAPLPRTGDTVCGASLVLRASRSSWRMIVCSTVFAANRSRVTSASIASEPCLFMAKKVSVPESASWTPAMSSHGTLSAAAPCRGHAWRLA
jgi:hypothetical protein